MTFIVGIEIVLLSFLPALIYMGILFVTTPYKSWNFGRAMAYLLAGVISVPFLIVIHNMFPFWGGIHEMGFTAISQTLLLAFIEVALFEEAMKYSLFWFFRKWVLKVKLTQHPIAIMVYAGAVSLGFAFIENIEYGIFQEIRYGMGINTVWWRTVSSVIIHMTCGMMMGYFISLSKYKYKIKTNPMGTSIFDIVMKNKPLFRKIFFTSMGILVATFFHGLYDFNIMGVYDYPNSIADRNIVQTIQLVILIISLYVVKNMSNHLIKLNIKNKAYEN